ncbi:non-ribosomal peptide synthetase [Streptomyces violens]|uniref:non-ribosomal peptide synthetase n=1 Tax=Streptomyces violens TaxID=66377 RepID=UPI00069056D8|nr:non-ribosomal peptide synthetase [Streptomyces violens]
MTTVTDLLDLRFAAMPGDDTAVTCAGEELSWRALDDWSRAVARHLTAHGAGPGTLVPVLTARGGALIAGWLGALRAGAAFVPLAMDTPAARIAFVLRETGAATVLVDEAGAGLLRGLDTDAKPVDLAEIRELGEAAGPPAALRPCPEDPAVVIFTSGTTGRPKGVLVPHRGLLNTALWWAADCGLGTADRLLVTAGTAFDPAAFNVVEGLLAGARLVLADDVERRDPAALLRLVHGPDGATVAGSVTPSLLHAMLSAEPDAGPGGCALRVVYSGGEALPRSLAADCARRWGAEVRNVYGPAEASCNSTCHVVDPGDTRAPAIGRPLPNTRAYVLGPHGEELPASVPGELYVAGAGVALGYLGMPDRTAAAFLPDPYADAPDALMYRTGDRVLVRADGELEYLGRIDDQVKILGNRIEPDEVRALIEENPAVAAAAVHATGTPKRLVAYVELAADAAPTHEDIVRPLLNWLPAAVLPAEVHAVAALPRTANDKVDFAALAELRDRPLPRGEHRPAPLTDDQRKVARLMATVLAEAGPDRGDGGDLAPDSDFFTLGGHSLLAVRMLAAAEREWGTAVPLRAFLADPTVGGLARALAAAGAGTTEAARTADGDGPHPATPVQQRLWLMDRLPAVRAAYLAPGVVEIDGPVDRALLRDAFAAVLARHPALRSRFTLDTKARRVQYRTDGSPPEVTLLDAAAWTREELDAHLARECWAPVDLARQAPARGEVIALAGDRTVLLYAVHHIVSDGWSLDLVMDELAAGYRELSAGRPFDPPPAAHPASLPAPAVPDGTLDALLAGLRGAPTDIALPYDRPRQRTQSIEAATTRELRLPVEDSARLREIAAELGCTTFMTAAALLAAVLARRSTQRDFLFAFPWAGRDSAGAAGTVGMFVNTLLLRADLSGRPSWRTLLTRVKGSALTAYRHADAPFDALAAALHPERDLGRPPVTPVYLSATDAPATPPALGPGITTRYRTPPALKLKYELELTATGGADRLGFQLTYATALFDAVTADALLGDLAAAAADLTTDLEAPVLTDATPGTVDATAPADAAVPADPAALTEAIGAAWRDVLDVPAVPYDVNFFDAGGDSLLLIVLLDQLSGLTDRELDAADLFQHSTVHAQAALLAGADGPDGADGAARENTGARSGGAAAGRARLLGRRGAGSAGSAEPAA